VPRGAFDPNELQALAGILEPHPSDPQRVVLTRRGRLMANDVSARMR
jgi:hypothetical protein